MRRAIAVCFCLCTLVSVRGVAQINDAPALQHYFDFSAEDTNKIILDFWNQNFLKNSEYFGPVTHGMTLFGDDINAQIGWVPDKHVLLLGGIYVRKDFGNPDLTIVQPTWTLKLQNNNGISFLFGNLEGYMDHRYIEPLYEYYFPNSYYGEKVSNPLETGLQFKIDKPWLHFDVWINWAHQEYLGSNFHEHIRQGATAELTIFHPNDQFSITVPGQYTLFHYGGQIDTARSPYVTIFNGCTGLCLNWDFSKKNSFISTVKFENYVCTFDDISINSTDVHTYPYTTGNGGYFNLLVKSKFGFGAMASLWDGNFWVDPIGGDLYQSVSWVYKSFKTPNRLLVFGRLFYQKELFPNLYVDLRLEPYYDIRQQFTEFSYFIFATYKRTFTLTKVHLPKFNDGAYSH